MIDGGVLSAPVATAPAAVVTGAFGLVALLDLVSEDRLVEAHEVAEPPWATALFFVGFPLLSIAEDTPRRAASRPVSRRRDRGRGDHGRR